MPLGMSPRAQHRWPSGSCPAWQPEPATNGIAVERDLTDVVVSARPFAELVAPPTMRHQSEAPTAVIADLTPLGVLDSHDILLRILTHSSWGFRLPRSIARGYCGMGFLFAAI